MPQGKSIEPVTAYRSKGFARIVGLFEESELAQLHEVLLRFHSRWQEANTELMSIAAL